MPVITYREFFFSRDVIRVFARGQKNFLSAKNTNMPQNFFWSHCLVMTGTIIIYNYDTENDTSDFRPRGSFKVKVSLGPELVIVHHFSCLASPEKKARVEETFFWTKMASNGYEYANKKLLQTAGMHSRSAQAIGHHISVKLHRNIRVLGSL